MADLVHDEEEREIREDDDSDDDSEENNEEEGDIARDGEGAENGVVEEYIVREEELEELKAGEVGYIAASIKSLSDIHVGDTITQNLNPADEPLKGYKKVQPMVYCGIYPIDGSQFEALKFALEKLKKVLLLKL